MSAFAELWDLLPLGAAVNAQGHLVFGGVSIPQLATRFGTPLYVYDETTIRDACNQYLRAFTTRDPRGYVHYASKAYLARWLCKILNEEDMSLDVGSCSEMHLALAAEFPATRMRLHGNNKSESDLREAIAAGLGDIVVDNRHELDLLSRVAGEAGRQVSVLLRVSPDVDADTHEFLNTGRLDSKFGLPIATGDASHSVRAALSAPYLHLRGFHFHIGTSLFDPCQVTEALRRVVHFAQETRADTGFWPDEISPGGGLGIPYTPGERRCHVSDFARAIEAGLTHAKPRPKISVEPGRSIIGRAGVAVYSVGARKCVKHVRTYLAVDGGMADNIRPALYGARYTALAAGRMNDSPCEMVTVAGRYCESGDILVRDAELPELGTGDLIALPSAGAYCLAMSSQYNGALRPAVVAVRDGAARLVQRRGTVTDLLTYDVD